MTGARASDHLDHDIPGAHVLPGIDQPSGQVPQAASSVLRAYRDGLAITDGAAQIEGWLMPFGVLGLFATALGLHVAWLTSSALLAVMGVVMMGSVGAFSLLAILYECTGYRDQPVLFDRKAKRVHVLQGEREWLRPWTWFRIALVTHTFEWARIRAMIVPAVAVGGAGVPRTHYTLRLVHTNSPGSPDIEASFGVGLPGIYDHGAEPAALWEHLRQFMQGEGPHLGPGDTLYVDGSQPGQLWNALWWGQPLLGPGSIPFWTGPYWFLTIPFGLFTLILLPLTMVGGALRWLAYRCKRPAPWPPAILESVGPELDVRARTQAR